MNGGPVTEDVRTGLTAPGEVVRFDPVAAAAEVRRRRGPTPDAPWSTDQPGLPSGYSALPHETLPMSRRRRLIADHMVGSRARSAHASVETDIDLGRIVEARAQLNTERLDRGLPKLSYLPLLVRAIVATLRGFPDLNASIDGDTLFRWSTINLGVAVDAAEGLLVPVIPDAQHLNALALADRISDLSTRARAGRISATELATGTFTVSNIGSQGAVIGSPVLNQPQVGIIVLGTAVRRPVVIPAEDGSESIGIRPVMRANLTFDHRIVDGADGARFLQQVRSAAEGWSVLSYR